MSEKVEFLAYLPPIQSAIKVSGEGDTMRIQLEVSLRVSPVAFRIALFTGKPLKVSVEEVIEKQQVNNAISEGTERKSRWTPTQDKGTN